MPISPFGWAYISFIAFEHKLTPRQYYIFDACEYMSLLLCAQAGKIVDYQVTVKNC